MADNDWNDIDIDDPDTDASGLRAVAKAGKKSLGENADLKRENAMLKAGIDTDDPRQAFFASAYKGEMSKEAILRAATELGFIAPVVDPAAAQNQVSLAADQRVQAMSPGAVAPVQGPAGSDGLADAYNQVLATTGNPMQARAAMLAAATQNGIPIAE